MHNYITFKTRINRFKFNLIDILNFLLSLSYQENENSVNIFIQKYKN